MNRIEWLKKRFAASVNQGFGRWMDPVRDEDLGIGVFIYDAGPTVKVFEDGLTYERHTIRYDQIVGLDLLDLRALMHAQKTPRGNVEITIGTKTEKHVLRMPLLLYTTLVDVLQGIVRETGQGARSTDSLNPNGES